MEPSTRQVTELLAAWGDGDREAFDQLVGPAAEQRRQVHHLAGQLPGGRAEQRARRPPGQVELDAVVVPVVRDQHRRVVQAADRRDVRDGLMRTLGRARHGERAGQAQGRGQVPGRQAVVDAWRRAGEPVRWRVVAAAVGGVRG